MSELRMCHSPELQTVARVQIRVPDDQDSRVRQRHHALARHRHPDVHLALLEYAVRVTHPKEEARLGYDHPRAELVLLLERPNLRQLRGADRPLDVGRVEPIEQEPLRSLELLQRTEDIESDLPVRRRRTEPLVIVGLALEERLCGDAEAGEQDNDLVVEPCEGLRHRVGDDREGVAGRGAKLLLAGPELGDTFLVQLRMEHENTLQ